MNMGSSLAWLKAKDEYFGRFRVLAIHVVVRDSRDVRELSRRKVKAVSERPVGCWTNVGAIHQIAAELNCNRLHVVVDHSARNDPEVAGCSTRCEVDDLWRRVETSGNCGNACRDDGDGATISPCRVGL